MITKNGHLTGRKLIKQTPKKNITYQNTHLQVKPKRKKNNNIASKRRRERRWRE